MCVNSVQRMLQRFKEMDHTAYQAVDKETFWQHANVKAEVEMIAEKLRSMASCLEKVGPGDERSLKQLVEAVQQVQSKLMSLEFYAADPPTPYGLEKLTLR